MSLTEVTGKEEEMKRRKERLVSGEKDPTSEQRSSLNLFRRV